MENVRSVDNMFSNLILHAHNEFDLIEILLDSFIDSLKVLLASFIVYFILGFFE